MDRGFLMVLICFRNVGREGGMRIRNRNKKQILKWFEGWSMKQKLF